MHGSKQRGSQARRRWSLLALAALAAVLLTVSAGPAHAWGRIAHRVCGKLTDAMLTPKARQEVRKLLEEGESLADASTWADEVRDSERGSASWHFVNVPLAEAAYSSRFCNRNGCVVSKIDEMRRILADTKRSNAERRRALRFLVHLVQDLHQPMHVGDNRDKGGNDLQVTFYGQGWNLHSIWDSGLLSKMDRNEDRHVARIRPKLSVDKERAWGAGSPEDWATESLLIAKKAYLNPENGRVIRTGERLDESYVAAHRDEVDQRLLQASVRLAKILNDVLK